MLRVRVHGEGEVRRAFAVVVEGVRDLSPAWARTGRAISRTAAQAAPTLTGRLVASIRPRPVPDGVEVGSRLIYAGVQNYGWPARNIRGHHFLDGALVRHRDTPRREVAAQISRVIRVAGLS